MSLRHSGRNTGAHPGGRGGLAPCMDHLEHPVHENGSAIRAMTSLDRSILLTSTCSGVSSHFGLAARADAPQIVLPGRSIPEIWRPPSLSVAQIAARALPGRVARARLGRIRPFAGPGGRGGGADSASSVTQIHDPNFVTPFVASLP